METVQSTAKASIALKRSTLQRITDLITYAILITFSGIMILPFIWMVSSSLKNLDEVSEIPIRWIPETFRFSNYVEVFQSIPMGRFILNSFFVAISVTILAILVSSLAAYAFARLNFKGKSTLFLCFLTTMMIPQQVTMIPNFLIMKEFGWLNTYNALIFPQLFTAFGVFMLRQFFLSIPVELEEAARIDGCSRFRIYWNIMIPLAKPAFVTLGIFLFLGEWNSFLWPLIVIDSVDLQPIQVGLRTFQGEFTTHWHLMMAGAFIAELPVLLFYVFCQRYIIEGIATSGIKG
ncbi:carbohydrate ABC transporter permease [Paenibacillus radicis (ex Xue et al. 2023)]|uniref:Carbohydrate ABC transporter permease n=1 Tax=Paenibacillus radicis (ex Xue et al. 2023) TaxID=2972489 RepID=A0ABT1YQT7_9BACL|nr:carbohydrate ABC transporter permease [Paenibacillus radicis (ex Xue et al. 2023)]MCR8635542.1 carbohydrate ABC transporter permease [Paenibacillus radicis (ex Xue et al. 2023)]